MRSMEISDERGTMNDEVKAGNRSRKTGDRIKRSLMFPF
jgi:hypothetical protein